MNRHRPGQWGQSAFASSFGSSLGGPASLLTSQSCVGVIVVRRTHRPRSAPRFSATTVARFRDSLILRLLDDDIVRRKTTPARRWFSPNAPAPRNFPTPKPHTHVTISISLLEGSRSCFPNFRGWVGAISWMKIRRFDFCCWRSRRLFSLRLRTPAAESSVVVPPPGILRSPVVPASAFGLW